ncbi:hypothetical protein AT00_13555 [Pseudoalteromonas lipolytica SCSIO 04301]|uniref:hypothetical protein n=1 Tax=Pseudoalteromonas TaxID=53246 RepID=UPI0004498A55|nr:MULTISPECIES: hypothetical protein [Pseudoalteromonas]EWH05756.1 hypothetical protein AT00_13555 [Pseudoalteromonas lipolytica SCSIO 04301]QLJ09970.1 hypothetical protein GZH31_18445 [Pseudoalteromonas sp. JSTW]
MGALAGAVIGGTLGVLGVIAYNEMTDDGDVDEIEDFNPEEDTMEDNHKTKDGKPRIKITKGDGSEIDITEDRVKRKDPAPNNPNGKGNDRKWNNPQPGSKGKKRDPLPKEREKIEELKRE